MPCSKLVRSRIVLILTLSLVIVVQYSAFSQAGLRTGDIVNDVDGDMQTFLPIVLRQPDYSESTGILDPDFGGGDGWVTTDVGGEYDVGSAITIQEDGKIIVAGSNMYYSPFIHSDYALVRFNQDGSLDTSFGKDGKVITDFLGYSDRANCITLQPDGKIIVAGSANVGTGDAFSLARYLSNGSLDTSFGGDGLVITNFSSYFEWVESVVLQPDGKIVVGGGAYFNDQRDIAVARYNLNGTLDTTFGVNGLVTTDVSSHDWGRDVILQRDGKILVTGTSNAGIILIRYNSNGSLDSTFGSNGLVVSDFSTNAEAIALQSDGKILVAGSGDRYFALARFNPDGSLDASFDSDGWVLTEYLGYLVRGYDLAVQVNGKIVVAGIAIEGSEAADFAMARYNSDGALDLSFGFDGMLTTDFFGRDDGAYGIALQPDGKLVLAGYADYNSLHDFAVVRYK